MIDRYPQWLRQGLIDCDFPWEKAHVTTMPRFLEEYTLHDSEWIGLWFVAGDFAIIVLRFDSGWSIGRITYSDGRSAEWPILLIGLAIRELLCADDFSEVGDGIGRAACEAHSDNHVTILEDFSGRQVLLTHKPQIKVLCIDNQGQVLPIPDL